MSPEDRRRYGRQIRLVDIGEAGQAKLCAADEVALASSTGFARTIEERYVRAAGLRTQNTSARGAEPTLDRTGDTELATALGLRHDAPREVAEGAWHALVAIRRALGVESLAEKDRRGE